MSANEQQVGGDHYQTLDPQPWDVTMAWEKQGAIGQAEAAIIWYLARWRKKGGIESLRKARHWLDKLIERETGEVRVKPERPHA